MEHTGPAKTVYEHLVHNGRQADASVFHDSLIKHLPAVDPVVQLKWKTTGANLSGTEVIPIEEASKSACQETKRHSAFELCLRPSYKFGA